jgi:RHS repeat-associated protein
LLKQGACPGSTYQYDAENRLKSYGPGTATYFYNNDGQRVKKVVGTTATVYVTQGITGNVLSEVVNGAWSKDYIYLGGQLLATESATQGTRYHFSDHLGTPRLVTADTGSIICRHDYYPFGQERTVCNDGETHKFTGQERDAESALDYFGARYYASNLGRFMIPDPLMASARTGNPQTLNRYSYVLNNPLAYVDPTGYQTRDSDTASRKISAMEDAMKTEKNPFRRAQMMVLHALMKSQYGESRVTPQAQPSGSQRPRSPVRYSRAPGSDANGSGTNRSAVSSGRFRYPRATPAPPM